MLAPVPETRQDLAENLQLDEPDLQDSLARPAGLARAIAAAAVRVVPDIVALSMALMDEGLTFTLACSLPAANLDAMQSLGEGGPCVEAIEEASTTAADIADVLDDGRWHLYARAAAAAAAAEGIQNSLSMPILQQGRRLSAGSTVRLGPRLLRREA